ncbi:MAG: hypothetical protein ACOYNI_07240 [Acidimicrobiia bacterium]
MSRTTTSSARAPRRRPQPQTWKPTRNRSEIVITVLVVVGIVAITALLVWMLRPESKPGAGDGGILTSRAPAAWWILSLVFILGIGYTVGKRFARGRRVVAIGLGLVITATIGGLLAWTWPANLEFSLPKPPKQPTPSPPQALGSLLPPTPQPFPTPPAAAPPASDGAAPPTGETPAPPTTPGK